MNMFEQLVSKYPDKFECMNNNMTLYSRYCSMTIGYFSASRDTIHVNVYNEIENRGPRLVEYYGTMQIDFNYDSDDAVVDIASFEELEKYALEYDEVILRIRKKLIKEERIKKIMEL